MSKPKFKPVDLKPPCTQGPSLALTRKAVGQAGTIPLCSSLPSTTQAMLLLAMKMACLKRSQLEPHHGPAAWGHIPYPIEIVSCHSWHAEGVLVRAISRLTLRTAES
jgi:hypothetical protein